MRAKAHRHVRALVLREPSLPWVGLGDYGHPGDSTYPGHMMTFDDPKAVPAHLRATKGDGETTDPQDPIRVLIGWDRWTELGRPNSIEVTITELEEALSEAEIKALPREGLTDGSSRGVEIGQTVSR